MKRPGGRIKREKEEQGLPRKPIISKLRFDRSQTQGLENSQRGIVKGVLTLHDPGQPSGGLGRSVVEPLESLSSLGHPGVDAGDVFESVGDELSHIDWFQCSASKISLSYEVGLEEKRRSLGGRRR